jgi:hypothetical protein
MNITEKEKLYDEVLKLEKNIRKNNPKQSGRVMIANAKCDIDMCIGRMTSVNEIQWLIEYRDKLRGINL